MDEATATSDAPPEDRKTVFNGLLDEGVRKKDTELVTLALKNGAEPNQLLFAGILYKPTRWDKVRKQHLTLNVEWVKLALDAGADVQATKIYKDGQPWPAIHWAQAYFNPCVMGMLLDRGACVDTVSPAGRTLLMDAVRNGYVEEIELYLNRGADPLKKCADGSTPLQALEESRMFDKNEIMRLKKLMMTHTAAASNSFNIAALEVPAGEDNSPSPGKRFSI